jgi:glucosamine--fructose-6-phosphate aminotransferase (isomerizing)
MSSDTLREILSQPETWQKTFQRAEQESWQLPPEEHKKSSLLFVGCGSSFYLAQCAATAVERLSGCPSRALPASEVFLSAMTSITPAVKSLAVAISRSGATTETLWAVSFMRQRLGIPVIGLTCYGESTLAHESNRSMVVPEAQEKSVVMTRSFTAQLLALLLASAKSASNHGWLRQMAPLSGRGEKLLAEKAAAMQALANDSTLNHFVFLGQGIFHGAANEAMLKMKEMSLSYSEAYYTLEYRHGPMSIAGKNTLITIFMSDAAREHETRVLADMKKLGAHTLVFCDRADGAIATHADHLIALGEDVPEEGRLLLAVPIMHLLCYYRALAKNLNPDAPRNLSQVVKL